MMTSSTRKKKNKNADFQKTTHKVGKTKPKASNFTDTSFAARRINFDHQSLSVEAPTVHTQFSHHLAHLRHPSAAQRQESLAYLTRVVGARVRDSRTTIAIQTSKINEDNVEAAIDAGTHNEPSAASPRLPEPASLVLPRLFPLLVDGSPAVRSQLLKLLQQFEPSEVRPQVANLSLYCRAAMTHLSADIRTYAVDVLAWLLRVAGPELVSCPGGWTKTMQCFLSLLGWSGPAQIGTSAGKVAKPISGQTGWTNMPSKTVRLGRDSGPSSSNKALIKLLDVLALLLRTGLHNPAATDELRQSSVFPFWHTQNHLAPHRANPYAYLELFQSPTSAQNDDMINDDNKSYEDAADRRAVYLPLFHQAVRSGLDTCKKEGGEIGRSAAVVERVVAEGIADEDR